MCGNCRIFRHFLLLPLLLSDPPERNERKKKVEGEKNAIKQIVFMFSQVKGNKKLPLKLVCAVI
jgi:hypothetical protein